MKLTWMILAAALALPNAYAAGEAGKPCLKIKQACEAAGFKKGGHKEGKGLLADCMKKLAQGESVAGVGVSADDVAACKTKRAERKEKKAKRQAKRQAKQQAEAK